MADSRVNHPQHDLELVAAWAAGEATGADLERAERLLDACDRCVSISRDLRLITLALQELPAVDAMPALPPAPRDFRLTPEQAARLHPSAPLVRWTDRLVAAVAALGKPVGVSLATLGLVGLLVGTSSLGVPGRSAASATSAPVAADHLATAAPAPGGEGGAAGNVPAATSASGGTGPGPKSTDTSQDAYRGGAGASAGPYASTLGSTGSTAPSETPAPGPATWLLALSLVAIAGGVGLIVVATRRG
ncbi:MAG TPA: hypothetical protein VE011_04915 [Candidatus Dormibacteraeota bacterium]|nr:hypothetical protein [Candidatus Dormibacteraeota bacterium]